MKTTVHGTIYSINTTGTSFNTVYTFTGETDGDELAAGRLIEDSSGNLYEASYGTGVSPDYGAVFEFTPGVGLTVFHTFDNTDGSGAFCSLLLIDGVLYGATETGGANGDGTLYSDQL